MSALHSSFLPSQTMGAAEKIICNILDTHARTHTHPHAKKEKKLIYGLQKKKKKCVSLVQTRSRGSDRLKTTRNQRKSFFSSRQLF